MWLGTIRNASLAAAAGVALVVGAAGAADAPLADRTVAVSWTQANGVRYRAEIDREIVAAFKVQSEARREAARRRLADLIERVSTEDAALIFSDVRGRTAAFADWVYGWVTSYLLPYHLAVRAARATYSQWTDGGGQPLFDRLAAELTGYVDERFQQIVTHPVETETLLRQSQERLIATLESEWEALRAADERAWLALADAHGRRIARADLHAADAERIGSFAARPLFAGFDRQPTGLSNPVDADGNDVIMLRSVRPIATRIAILGVRFTELGTLLTFGGAVGAGTGTLAGAAIAYAAAAGVVWSFDYAVNQADASLNRADFESRLTTALEAMEQRAAASQRDRLLTVLAAHALAERTAGR